MWCRTVIAFFMLLAIACNEPRHWATVFVDETCTKRRFDVVDGQSVTVSTYEPDGTLTVTTHFETVEEAKRAYPTLTSSRPCPETVTVTASDLQRNRPLPDAGAAAGQ